MARNFRDFKASKKDNTIKNERNDSSSNGFDCGSYTNENNGANVNRDDVENIINHYASKSQNEIMNELMGRIAQAKSQGGISPQEIETMYNNIAPMLSPEQLEKFKQLIKLMY